MAPFDFGRLADGPSGAHSGKLGYTLPKGAAPIQITGKDTVPLVKDAGPAAPAVGAKLTKKTNAGGGPTATDCGGFSWIIQWMLDKAAVKDGWIVQKVEVTNDIKDCAGKAVAGNGLNTTWYPLWEAWPVHAGQKVTTYAEGGDLVDDTYVTGGSPGTKGSTTVKGTAEFYDGLTLPPAFKVTNKAPTWILPATKSDPALTGGSGSIAHTLTATWDCCGADKTTKLTAT